MNDNGKSINRLEPLFGSERDGSRTGTFTKRDAARVVFSHKQIILFCFVAATVLVSVGLFALPMTYESAGKVLVKTEEQGRTEFFSGVAAYRERYESDPVNRRIETEMELVEAHPLSEAVVAELGLTYDQVYHKPLTHILGPVADLFDWTKSTIFRRPIDPEKRGFRDTVEEFNKSIAVHPLRSKSADTNSNIIAVTLKSPDPDIARDALAKLLDNYVRFDTRINAEAGQTAYEIVERDLELAKEEVAHAEDQLHRFLVEHSVAKGVSDGSATAPGRDEAATRAITSPRDEKSTQLLKARLVELEAELVDASQVYVEDTEKIRTLRQAIDDLKDRIDRETTRGADNEVQLRYLERELRTAELRHNALVQKLQQISLFLEMNESSVANRVVIEPPMRPKSSDIKKRIVLAIIGSFGGLLLGLTIAGFREYTDPRLRTKDEAVRELNLDILAALPEMDEGQISHLLLTRKN